MTARGDEVDRVVGLELGADDYIVKPFGFRELLARIRAVTRRTQARPDELAARDRRAADHRPPDPPGRRSTATALALTPKEFDLLALLAEAPGTVFTRAQILEEVWDAHWYGPTKTLDVHVAALRKKLGDAGVDRDGARRRVPARRAGRSARRRASTVRRRLLAQLPLDHGLRAARARDPARVRVRAVGAAPADERGAARRAGALDPGRGRAGDRTGGLARLERVGRPTTSATPAGAWSWSARTAS